MIPDSKRIARKNKINFMNIKISTGVIKRIFVAAALYLTGSVAMAQSGWYSVPGAPTSERFEDVSFIGNTGWIAKNNFITYDDITIFKTIDGGDTWFASDTIPLPVSSAYGARSIEFLNDSVGFVGLLNVVDTLPLIYKTTDGGVTFTPVVSPVFNYRTGVCGMAHFGNTIIGVGRFDSEGNFYKSTDEGVNWSVLHLDTNIVTGLVDCYMFNDSVYVISGRGPDNGVEKGIILKTFDGGLTWQKIVTSSAPASWVWKLNFRENGKGTGSIEHSDKIFMTADSGSTWSEVTIGTCTQPEEGYGGNGFLNDTLGWSADQYGSGCMVETRDGGTTWNSYNFGSWVDRMVRIDSVTMLAVGGTVYKFSVDSLTSEVKTLGGMKSTTLQLLPNPVDDKLTVVVNLSYRTSVHLVLMNVNYQVIKDLPEEYLMAGEHIRSFNTSELPAGTYFVTSITRIDHQISKVQVIH